MDHTFRFILEEPSTGSSKGQNNRKRARLVTACDNCRLKKIKCIRTAQLDSELPCEACKVSNTDCSYTDRDRYQNERGLSFASTIPPQPPTPVASVPSRTTPTEESGRKRKASIISSPEEQHEPLEDRRRNSNAERRPSILTSHNSSHTTISANGDGSRRSVISPIQTTAAPPPEPVPDPALKRITVPFFRYFGPTANTPGYRKVKVRTLTLNEVGSPISSSSDSVLPVGFNNADSNPIYPYSQRVHPENNLFFSSIEKTGSASISASSATTGLFDPHRPRYPSSKYLPHLAGLFFDHLACHFPFLDRKEVMQAVETETLPAVLANCIAALACRFSENPELLKAGKRAVAGEAFADMAKLLVVHMLSWPSVEVVQTLVLLAWAEFGSGRDSGLWMYSRMAVAMAMDLGLQFEATVQLATTQPEKEKIRLTWWSCILIDRINSWGTGRPIAIADDQFDVGLPLCPVDPHENITQPPPPSLVFGQLASLVQLRGKIGDVLNNLVKKSNDMTLEMELTQLQYEMTTWYQNLPPSLVFNIHNFRRFSHHKQSPIFLLLHCMFHSVITLLHRPSLLQRFTPAVALPLANSIDMSRSSARSLVDMVSLADEVDSDSLIANPFLDLPILTAARSFLAEREFLAKPPENMSPMMVLLMRQWSETSLDRCKDALKKMSKFWGGVGCVKRILDQQSAGDLDFDVGEGSSGDTHMAHLRDVELITQWATKAWRRQGNKTQLRIVKQEPETTNPTAGIGLSSLTTSPQSATYPPPNNGPPSANGATPTSNHGVYQEDSPAGASVGITGILDGGPFSFLQTAASTTHQNGNGAANGHGGFDSSLRVSFNSAEADLSFPNSISTEIFSIPDALEEFLGGAMDVANHHGQHATQGAPAPNGGLDLQHLATGQLEHTMAIPAFTTLIAPWFPMGQFSRAPSPVPHNQK
ncbi:hypothetical protein FRC01_005150 [Tulasnella sp. 417]|nr:hypothetical protein FRC01_005150 [Tulasnella sp. 417]